MLTPSRDFQWQLFGGLDMFSTRVEVWPATEGRLLPGGNDLFASNACNAAMH
jgi:hypothetical protein